MVAEKLEEENDYIEMIIDLVNQACQTSFDYSKRMAIVDHSHISTYEYVFGYLEIEGHLKKILRGKNRGKYWLSWSKRKDWLRRKLE